MNGRCDICGRPAKAVGVGIFHCGQHPQNTLDMYAEDKARRLLGWKGQYVKRARQSRGMMRRELADALDVHWGIIVDWENGASEPDHQQKFALCRTLRYPLKFFMRALTPPLPMGSLAYHGDWSDEEIEAL